VLPRQAEWVGWRHHRFPAFGKGLAAIVSAARLARGPVGRERVVLSRSLDLSSLGADEKKKKKIEGKKVLTWLGHVNHCVILSHPDASP
jgi:hypothetical protein